jgi:hypothetical protein
MEDAEAEESQVPVAASLESRSNRKKMPAATGIRGGRGRGRGSAATTAKSTAPSASTDTVCIPQSPCLSLWRSVSRF